MTDSGDRRDDARRRVEMNEAARRAEAAEAQVLVDAFVAEAGRRGLAPEPLKAKTYSGALVKTDKRGWYLNRSHSLAIGEDGGYFRLTVPDPGLLARFTGVKLQAEPPSLLVGAGGRDGEGGELSWFLQRVLDGGL
nr:hypothetical protein [Propionibacterium sp.]